MDYKYDVQVSCRLTYGKFSYFVTDWYTVPDPDNYPEVQDAIEHTWRIVKACEDLTVDHMRIMRVRELKNA